MAIELRRTFISAFQICLSRSSRKSSGGYLVMQQSFIVCGTVVTCGGNTTESEHSGHGFVHGDKRSQGKQKRSRNEGIRRRKDYNISNFTADAGQWECIRLQLNILRNPRHLVMTKRAARSLGKGCTVISIIQSRLPCSVAIFDHDHNPAVFQDAHAISA